MVGIFALFLLKLRITVQFLLQKGGPKHPPYLCLHPCAEWGGGIVMGLGVVSAFC